MRFALLPFAVGAILTALTIGAYIDRARCARRQVDAWIAKARFHGAGR